MDMKKKWKVESREIERKNRKKLEEEENLCDIEESEEKIKVEKKMKLKEYYEMEERKEKEEKKKLSEEKIFLCKKDIKKS